MRIAFPNLNRPKKAAKVLSRVLNHRLAPCQMAVAKACGYRDWHELEQEIGRDRITVPDQDLSADESVTRQVDMTLSIAASLNVSDNDAQYAVAMTNLIGGQKTDVTEQLDIRARCLRRTLLPDLGRRQRGSVGKVKSVGWNGELVVLKRFGCPTYILTNKAPNSIVADFEYLTPQVAEPLFIPMRFYLAYGMWTEKDGSQVLFSRDYKPLWRIENNGKRPIRADPSEWISYERIDVFWSPVNPPWHDKRVYDREIQRLHDFKIVGLPKLVEAFPYLVLRDELSTIDDAVSLLWNKQEPKRAA